MTLYPYQETGVRFLTTHPRSLLLDEQGLGKTRQALAALQRLNITTRTLIVCPKSVIPVWIREGRTLGLTLIPDIPGALTYSIVVTNYEKLDRFQNADIRALVLDEAHYIKNPKSQRSQRARELAKRAEIVWCLTGTPVLNRPNELWALLDAIGKVDMSWWKFSKTFSYACQTRFGWRFEGLKNQPLLQQMLKGLYLRRTKKEVLDQLPPKIRTTVEVDSSLISKLVRQEHEILERLGLTLEDLQDRRFIPELNAVRKKISLVKIPHTVQFAREQQEGETSVLLFCWFRESAELLAQKLKAPYIHGAVEGKKREEIYQAFREGKISFLVATIGTSSFGLNLQTAGCVVFHDLSYVPAQVIQAEDRVHRLGRQEPVNIYYLIARDSVESRVVDVLTGKAKTLQRLDQTMGSDAGYLEFGNQLKGGER